MRSVRLVVASTVGLSACCVCERVAASTRDDADERQHLLTDDTAATAHSDVAETIPLARLDEFDDDEQTEAIPSTAGAPTLPSSSKIIFAGAPWTHLVGWRGDIPSPLD